MKINNCTHTNPDKTVLTKFTQRTFSEVLYFNFKRVLSDDISLSLFTHSDYMEEFCKI